MGRPGILSRLPAASLGAQPQQAGMRRRPRSSGAAVKVFAVLEAPKCPMGRMGGANTAQSSEPQAINGTLPPKFSSDSFDYAPFQGPTYQTRYKMTMGLQPMKPDDWIEIDEYYEEEMALRQELVQTTRNTVIQSRPEAAEVNKELLEMLVEFLPRRYPDRFSLQGSKFTNHAMGQSWDLCDPALDPLEVSALNVQEDLCLCAEDSQGVLRFVSGAVLFPQRWSLLEKMGMDMHRIHEPVPLFAKEIQRPVDGFMSRISTKQPFWRANWTISDNPDLFQPLIEEDIYLARGGHNINQGWAKGEPITAENAGERLHTRCERETLVRFPRTRAVLFTIRTHLKELSHYAQQPSKAAELARALRNLPEDVKKYKTIAAFEQQAIDFLDNAAAGAGVVLAESTQEASLTGSREAELVMG